MMKQCYIHLQYFKTILTLNKKYISYLKPGCIYISITRQNKNVFWNIFAHSCLFLTKNQEDYRKN